MGVTSDKRYLSILLHVAAWTIIIVLPLYLHWITNETETVFLKRHYYHLTGYAVLFYLNYLWLMPNVFFGNRRWFYFLIISATIFVMFFVTEYGAELLFPASPQELAIRRAFEQFMQEQGIPKHPDFPFRALNYFFTAVLVTGFSSGLRIADRLRWNERKRRELEKERLHSELAFLKNQISPHFFFNTMNNIYSLIEISPEDARNAVHKLSGLMRYLLYESEQNETTLKKELDFLVNYIDLMKLRLSDKVELLVDFPKDFPDRRFPPLLFVPFIENAFKHGISYHDRSFVRIMLKADTDGVYFSCENSVSLQTGESTEERSGIGLENVRKRLQLLFPGKHKLVVELKPSAYSVTLEIYQ